MSAHGFSDRGLDSAARGVFGDDSGRFGRMFGHLAPAKPAGPAAALAVGGPGGPMDAAAVNPDNPNIPAGFTFLGQFLDHDITFDPTSSLEQTNDPRAVRNFRTPAFELDSVYGGGPRAQPYLYAPTGFKFDLKLGAAGQPIDVPRLPDGRALIGDPRNDENLIVNQIHMAVQAFHNKVLAEYVAGNITDVYGRKRATAGGDGTFEDFEVAQKVVRWHYQWIVLNEYVPLTVDGTAGVQPGTITARVLTGGRRWFRWTVEPFMPVEFAVAAFRFGHSQVRPGYGINGGRGGATAPFAAGLFAVPAPPPDAFGRRASLAGGAPVLESETVEWVRFFGPTAARSKAIDVKLSPPLLNLPDGPVPPGTPPDRRSLAVRNLLRGEALGLPSGETVALAMGEPPVANGLPAGTYALGQTPLWFYCLREAELLGGARLGPVGGTIVAEVFLGLLEGDTQAYPTQAPKWVPTLPGAAPFRFGFADLLAFAGVS